jgi:predicted dehydrogenase
MKVAVIGLGSAGRRHATLALELGHEAVGFDPAADPPAGVSRAATLDEALAGAGAAVVASPSALHAEHATAALRAGLPTLVEKPLATSADDARAVAEAARRAGRPCGVAMNLRFHPGPVALRRLVEAGELGPVHLARASFGYDLRRWRPGTDYRRSYSAQAKLGGGILLDAIHELDELLWLLGPAAWVSAELAHLSDLEIDVEDTAVAMIGFASGALATLDLNFFEPAYRRGCLLAGANAVAEWDWARETVVVRAGEDRRELPAGIDVQDTYRAELADFLEAAATGGRPRTTAEDGVAAVELVEAARRSAAEGRRVELAA